MTTPILAPTVCGLGTAITVQTLDGSLLPTNVLAYSPVVVQEVYLHGAGGNAGLTFSGQTTSLAMGSTAAQIAAALNALSSIIAAGGVTVAGEAPSQVTFTAGTAEPLITVGTGSLLATGTAPALTAGSTAAQWPDSSGGGYAKLGAGWAAVVVGYGTAWEVAAGGSGLNQAEWTITGLATGHYQVSYDSPISGSSNPTVSASTPFRFYDGSTPRARVVVNQSVFGGLLSFGSHPSNGFDTLATVYVSSGTLRVLVTDEVAPGDIGKFIVSNELAVVPVDPTAAQMAGGAVGGAPSPYITLTGTWHAFSAGWNGNTNYSTDLTGASSVVFSFVGLLPNSTYTFAVHWRDAAGATQTAAYTVRDWDGTVLGSATFDQSLFTTHYTGLSETDSNSNTWNFPIVGTFTVTGTTATIAMPVTITGTGNVAYMDAALAVLVTAGGYTEPVSATVTALSSGPPTISVNGGSAIPLTTVLWQTEAQSGFTHSPMLDWLVPGSPILATDVVTFTLSNNCITTVAGLVPGVTNQAVANRVGKTMGPGVPSPVTMGVGYNLMNVGVDLPFYANLVRNSSPVYEGSLSPTPALTATGYTQYTVAEAWRLPFGQGYPNPIDSRGYPLYPVGGTTTIHWDGANSFYPTFRLQTGTTISFVSVDSGHATGNTLQVIFGVDGSNTTYAPQFEMLLNGLNDLIWSGDTNRVSYTGTWTTQTGGWNGTFRQNSKSATDKATYSFGPVPAGTWNLIDFWPVSAGNTATASYAVKESGVPVSGSPVALNQTVAGSTGGTDYNGAAHNYTVLGSFAFTGGPVTVEVTGGTDGYLCADAIQLILSGTQTSLTPTVPFGNLKLFAPDPGINPASPPTIHPILQNRVKGSKVLRSLQALGGINGAFIDYADYPTSASMTCTGATGFYEVTKIETWGNPNGFFQSNKSNALFTVTAMNGAKLPLISGTPVIMPAGITINYSTGDHATIDFGNFQGIVEHDSGRMTSGQFAIAGGTVPGIHTDTEALTTVGPGSLGIMQVIYPSVVPTDYFALVASLPGCAAWVNPTPIATQACIVALANDYTAAMPVGSTCYLECSDEPFNDALGFPYGQYFLALSNLGSLGGFQQGYCQVSAQIQDWFRTALGVRAAELKTVFNCQGTVPSRATDTFTYCDAHSKPVDMIAIAIYVGDFPAGMAAFAALYPNLTAPQLIDCLAAWLHNGNYYQSVLAAYQTAVAGHPPTVLGNYEAAISSTFMGGNALTQELQSICGRYHPGMYNVILDFLAILQTYGVKLVNYYSLDQLPVADFTVNVTSCYGVYDGWLSVAGRGDGSDGKHDNRIEIGSTAPLGAIDFRTAVTPIGAALNTWNKMLNLIHNMMLVGVGS